MFYLESKFIPTNLSFRTIKNNIDKKNFIYVVIQYYFFLNKNNDDTKFSLECTVN